MSSVAKDPVGLRIPVAVAGVHGGAGTSVVCRWLGEYAVDNGTVLPEWVGWPMVLVCSGTADGVRRATERVAGLVARPVAVRLLLVVVGDSSAPEPAAARARIRALTPSVAAVVRLPYVESWRYLDDPLTRPAPRAYRRALGRLVRVLRHV